MKKVLSLLLVLTMVIGTTFTLAAAKTKAPAVQTIVKQGIIKNFNATSLTVIESGKTIVYTLAKNLKVVQAGNEVVFTESARKGMLASYKVQIKKGSPNTIISMELPGIGLIYEGIPGTSVSSEVSTTIAYQETAVSTVKKNSSAMIEASQLAINNESQVEYDTFSLKSASSIYIGTVLLVTDSIKLNIAGKNIKIIKADASFDPAVAGDEAKLVDTKGVLTLTLETPLTDAQQKDVDNVVKLNYKTKEFAITRLELNNMLVNENVYSELNGQEVSYAKAMYRGNYGMIETNDKSEIAYVNLYYKNLPCTVTQIENGKIGINAIKNGNPAFIDILTIDPGCTVQDKNGAELSLDDIYVGSNVLISTSPESEYKVYVITILD